MTTTTKPIKVLVVDDTIIYRKIVSDILNEMPGIEVVGTANNGKIAISRIAIFKPDLLILDVEMPEMDGLDVLLHIKDKAISAKAIMLSSFTQKGSDKTIKALELGAFDFIPKPETTSIEQSKANLQNTLSIAIKAFQRQFEVKNILDGNVQKQESTSEADKTYTAVNRDGQFSNVIAIGISTGGPNALQEVLPKLPANIGVPILIVQHMPPMFTKSLAESLNRKSALEILEAVDGQTIEPNVVLIAPGGKQMKVVDGPGIKKAVKITDDPPENSCRPSVDYLFRSVAQHYGKKATAVIMTGMGSDGKLGMEIMKQNGVATIAQDKDTCVVYGMPKEVIEAGLVDVVAPLNAIAREICSTIKTNQAVLI